MKKTIGYRVRVHGQTMAGRRYVEREGIYDWGITSNPPKPLTRKSAKALLAEVRSWEAGNRFQLWTYRLVRVVRK